MPGIGIGIRNQLAFGGSVNGSPSLLSTMVDSDTQISGSFTIGSTNQDGHYVYISTDNVAFTKTTVTWNTASSFTKTGLVENTTYYLYVKAYNGSKESSASNTASAITLWTEIALFNNNIISFYPMNETSGTSVVDVKNGYNLAIRGTYARNVTGLDGFKYTSFTGDGDLNGNNVGFNNINPLEGFVSFSIAMKVNSGWTIVSELINLALNASNRFILRPSTAGLINTFATAGGTYNPLDTDGYGNTQSVHLSMKWSKSNNSISMYINGILSVSAAYAGNFVGVYGTVNMFFHTNAFARKLMILNTAPSDLSISKLVNRAGMIVFEGDSRSYLKGWTGASLNYVNEAKLVSGKYGKRLQSASGSATPTMIARASQTNSFISSGVNILVVWIGVNDATTAQQTYDNIKLYCQNARSAGWNKIILCSEIDAQGVMGWHNTIYPALNALIYADHSFVDGLADLGARTELQDATNLTYYNADKVHPTPAGYAVVAEVVGNMLNTIIV